jgi:hypothetical protein
MNCKRLGCVQPKSSTAWHNGMSGGAPDNVQCARLVSGESSALGIRRRRTTIIHRTVRWCTGLSGESSAANSLPSGKAKGRRGYNSPDCPVVHRIVRWANCRQRQRSAAQSSRDAWQLQRSAGGTGLSDAPTGPKLQRSTVLCMERNRAPDMISSCPVVHHPTEGKFGLPSWLPTAPSCLGVITGTPRRMEKSPKLSLSILKHPNSAPTHLFHCVSDLSSIWVVNSVGCVSSSSRDLCAWLCCEFESCVCCSSQPYSMLSLWSIL